VNGAYEGGVGLNKVNIISMEIRPIYTPKKMFGRPYEVGKIRKFKDSICFIVSVPLDKYSSSRYLLRNQKDIIHDFGVSDFPKEIDSKIAIDKENNLFYLDDDHDLIKDPNFIIKYNSQNKQVFKKIININYHKAFLSPDGEFIFLDNYEGDACLLNVESMKKIQIKLPDSEIHSVIWSKDSKKIAIIQTHETMCKTDKLLLFRIK
ncbi:MAG: hypothetical protein H0W75_10210, partial [Chitinophagaceae bacterium]|nr:hypothetical protein [Chitinophagaceae bacterium]